MVKKKTTKQVRAIDRIIKFQIDDGIESLTIGGKTDLADLELDNKNNVTLHLNADSDKLNELKSLVPFITIKKKSSGQDPDKKKTVELIQDLREFAFELAEDSKQLAEIIKEESSITIDLSQLISRLNKIVDDVDNAQRTADRAETKADTAKETADRAETKADTAKETADRAEAKADTAQGIADNMQKQIDSIQSSITVTLNKLENVDDVEYFEGEDSTHFITRYEVVKKHVFVDEYGQTNYITMIRVKNHNNQNIDIDLSKTTNKGTLIHNLFAIDYAEHSDTLPYSILSVVGASLSGNIVNGHLVAAIQGASSPDLMIYVVEQTVPD